MTDVPSPTPPPQRSIPDPDDVEAPIQAYPWLYYLVLGIVCVGFFFVGFQLTTVSVSGFNLGYLVWVVGGLYLVASFRTIGPEVIAGVQFLEIPTIVATGHPIFVLPGLFTVVIVTRATIQMELPGEPENIFRKEDIEVVPEGMVPPVRITFARDQSSSTNQDPLAERITAEVSSFVRFRIKTKEFWSFFVRINTLEETRRQLNDMAVSMLQERLATLTAAEALRQQETVSDELDDLIRTKTVNWGIELIDARIKLYGFSHDLNSAIAGMAMSAAQKRSTILVSEGEQTRLTNEGVGRANAIEKELQARSQGLKQMAADLGVSGSEALGAETARAFANGTSNTTVVGVDGFKELVAVGKTIISNPTPST